MLFDSKDIGSRFDTPATDDQLATGQSFDGSPQPTLFSLLKGILLALIALEDNSTTNNVTSTAHGLAPISPADATKFLNGALTPDYAQVKDSDLATTNVTTNNVTIAKHGFCPILPNDVTKFFNGIGGWTVPGGGMSIGGAVTAGTATEVLFVGTGSVLGQNSGFTFN